MIAELEERGLLRRKGHPVDGRRIRLELTDAGHAVREDLNAAWRQVTLKKLATLSPEELELFTGLCRKLAQEPEL
jgi:DNA-binding MarR family transcriptional regulator